MALQRLEIMPCAGLANRMGALASAMVVAQEQGAELVIGWKWDQGIMVGDFNDLFEVKGLPSWIKVIEMRKKPDPVWNFSPEVNSKMMWEQLIAESKSQVLRFTSWASFYAAGSNAWYQSLRLLRPHPRIKKEIDRIWKTHTASSCVGVHIRRTDHKEAIQASPSSEFWAAMRKASHNTCFYVASDSESERVEARRLFYDRIIIGPKRLHGRARLKGCRDALVDFFSLAACGEVWGSKGSTFGALAAAYGFGKYRNIEVSVDDGR